MIDEKVNERRCTQDGDLGSRAHPASPSAWPGCVWLVLPQKDGRERKLSHQPSALCCLRARVF